MRRTYLYAKLHMAKVTDSHINYDGSITVDRDLMKMSGIHEFEKVLVANVSNGNRFETYVIAGKKGEIILNGATSHLGKIGDRVIIFSFCYLTDDEFKTYGGPTKIFLNEKNEMENIEK
ncbi:aspartate 1-decarboxylase [bacterium]|nr:aspartate 1-decarboxylase [bacterium]